VAHPRDRDRAPRAARRVLAVRRHRRRSHPRERSRRSSGPTHARTHTRNSGHEEVGSYRSAMQPGRRPRSLKESGRSKLEMRSFFRSHKGRSQRFLERGYEHLAAPKPKGEGGSYKMTKNASLSDRWRVARPGSGRHR
jgi:hypothetical protein